MPINDNYQQEQYIADGSITEFDFSFPVIEPKDIKVFVKDTESNIEEKTFNSDYTVNLNSNYSGKIIFTTAPSLNYKIFIQRKTDITQKSNYKTSSGFQAEEITNNLDKLTIICQEQQSSIDKSLKINSVSNIKFISFEEPQDGKNLVWKKNSDGTFSGTNSINNPDEVYSNIVDNENVKNVSNNINNINTVANNINNVDTVVSNITDLNNVATNIEAINSFNNWISTSGGSINYYIGQVISISCSPNYVPSGCLPCDGSEYSKEQFPDLWNNYLTATTPLLQTCTYEEYQQDIITYGQCIKFAVDTSKNTFKTFTIKDGSYITQAKSDSELGKSYNENLPNITGYLDVQDNSIYQNNAKVQGDNVRLRFFVVVANGEINQSQMDWSAWATSLNNKLNKDFSNIETTAKEIIYMVGAPDYENKIDIVPLTTYTASSNGYVYAYGLHQAGGGYNLIINNITFPWANNAISNAQGFICMPVSKGDKYSLTSTSGTFTSFQGYFIPVKTI